MNRRSTFRLLFTLMFSFSMVMGGLPNLPFAIAEDAVLPSVEATAPAVDAVPAEELAAGAGIDDPATPVNAGVIDEAAAPVAPDPGADLPDSPALQAAAPLALPSEGLIGPPIENPDDGVIVVTKTVLDSGGNPIDPEDLPEGLEFTVYLDGPGPEWDRTAVLNAGNGFTETFLDMHLGNYFVTEDEPGYTVGLRIDGELDFKAPLKFELEDSGHYTQDGHPLGTVDVVNLRDADGSLVISKEYRTFLGVPVDPTEGDEVTIHVTGPDEFDEGFVLSEANGWSKTFDELTAGDYVIEETAIEGLTTTYESDGEVLDIPATVHVMDGETTMVTVVNTRPNEVTEDTGTLEIVKEYRTSAGLPSTGVEVSVHVTGPDEFDETFDLNDGNDWHMIFTDLPAGDYVVNEITTGNFDTNYMVGDEVLTIPATAVVENADETVVTIVNMYRTPASPDKTYTVDKVANVTSAKPGDTITYTVTVKNTGTIALGGEVITDSLVNPLPVTVTPTIEPGASWSFSYTYKVPANYAGTTLVNVVKVGDISDTVTLPITHPTTTSTAPKTGDDLRMAFGYGAIALLAGATAVVTRRRRGVERDK